MALRAASRAASPSSSPGSCAGGRAPSGGASFTLTVTKPAVVNTAPSVTVANVVNGSSYEFGNVPVARCNVTDKEDGNKSFDASLSAVTGSQVTYTPNADFNGNDSLSMVTNDVGNTGTLYVAS